MVTSGLPRIGKTVEGRARRSCAQGIQVGGGNTPKEWAMKRKEEEEEEEHDDLSHDPRSKDDFQGKRRRPGKFAVYVQSDSGLDRTEVCCC